MTQPPAFSFSRRTDMSAPMGLVTLQSDETIERDFRQLLPDDAEWMVSRVASAPEVTRESLAQMEDKLSDAARLFPQGLGFSVIGYGCTSGTAQIGPDRIAEQIRHGAQTQSVTEPVSALVNACEHLDVQRLAFLSPYVASVSDHLREVLTAKNIDTPVFGSFNTADEATVVRIDTASILAASQSLLQDVNDIDALFLSCTNLRTLDAIAPLEAVLGIPVLSSNQVLAWHMMQLAGLSASDTAPGRLFTQG